MTKTRASTDRYQRGDSDWSFGALMLAVAVILLLFAHPIDGKLSIAESLQLILHKEASK